ncbi:hypothetical protein [uncultured Chryseobacterium sp.]|uniref:hypothetical protein n=1 Tax=uncultured Chryseobacterium sp. TaxID=259322 RepID=UPI0025FC7542|nr:hypothetical protein [uncultured Chryseobacterium sp.]
MVKKNLRSGFISGYTDKKGYFKMENKKESVADLIFSLGGYKIDTAVTVWTQHGKK